MRALVLKAGSSVCALPLSDVVETMRPLRATALAEVPAFVLGAAMIRGTPTPVVDLAALLGGVAANPRRYVTVRCGQRQTALAVDAVVGIHTLDSAHDELPPLLGGSELIDRLAILDCELLLVLRAGRLLPQTLAARLDGLATESQPA